MKSITQINEVLEKITQLKIQSKDMIYNDLAFEEKTLRWVNKIFIFHSKADSKAIITEELKLSQIYCDLYCNHQLYLRYLQCKIQTLKWVLS